MRWIRFSTSANKEASMLPGEKTVFSQTTSCTIAPSRFHSARRCVKYGRFGKVCMDVLAKKEKLTGKVL